MPIQFDKFDQQKVDRLRTHLEAQAEKGQSKYYEVFVDGLKAIQKTDDPREFDSYENYMTADTNEIRIVIYNSGVSPRNDQYVFSRKARNPQEALEIGLDGVSFKMLTKQDLYELKSNREKQLAESQRIQALNAEIADLKTKQEEQALYVSELEGAVERAKANGNKIGRINIGDAIMLGLEGFVRNNTKLIARVPALEGIALAIEQDNEERSRSQQAEKNVSQQEATEATFTKKTSSNDVVLSEDETHFLSLFRELQKKFTEQELFNVIEILDRLSQDKTILDEMLELLESSNEKTE